MLEEEEDEINCPLCFLIDDEDRAFGEAKIWNRPAKEKEEKEIYLIGIGGVHGGNVGQL